MACERSLETEGLGTRKVTAVKKQMREQSQGMSVLHYTGFWLRMGRDYHGASLLPLTISYLETEICRHLAFLSQQQGFCHSYILFLSLESIKIKV